MVSQVVGALVCGAGFGNPLFVCVQAPPHEVKALKVSLISRKKKEFEYRYQN